MIYANIWLTVKDAATVDQVRELLSEQGRLSRAEPGCARFEVYQSQNDATRFLLVERWESQESLDLHRTAHAYTTIYQPQVLPLVNREPHPSQLVSGGE
ncbi:MAG: putative quinol monooxygenase [Planctomycetota bacterium]|nr:putative quinol monooxygenase [Planctomycetota bacterium]